MSQRTRAPINPEAALSGARPVTGNKAARAALDQMVQRALPKVSSFKTRKERLHYVADMIEQEALGRDKIGFNMAVYYAQAVDFKDRTDKLGNATCGTVACIAGWTTLLEDGHAKYDPMNSNSSFHEKAAVTLMLSPVEAYDLFTPDGVAFAYEDITAKQAIAVIRDLADNDQGVRWLHYDDDGKFLSEPLAPIDGDD